MSAPPPRTPHGRKTIAYVGGFEVPDRNTAGLRVLANAYILRELGYEVVFFGLSRDLAPGSSIRKGELPGHPFTCWNAPPPRSGFDWLKRIAGFDGIARIIESEYGDSLAAVICYDFPAVAQLRLARLARRLGAAAIAEATEWYGRSRITDLHAIVRNIDTPARMRIVNRRMDGVIAASRFLRDYYADAVPVVELPTVMLDMPRDAGSDESDPDSRPKRLLFAATGFEPHVIRRMQDGAKDKLSTVIEALHIASRAGASFQLEVFGAQREDYLSLYPEHAGMLDEMEQSVHFRGLQPRETVRDEIRRADFSIFLRAPTIATLAGFPTKYAESIHLGTPVITNAVGSLTHYHVEGRTGYYIDYDDVDGAADKLLEILRLPAASVRDMKEHCRRSDRFGYRSWVAPVGQFLEEVRRRVTLRGPALSPTEPAA